MSKMLSVGCNRKLARDIGILNLTEQATCPGKTPLCTRVCYSKKARMYKAAVAKRAVNHALSVLPGFPEALAAEIQALGCTKVRFHEAGDVYDQAYLDKLVRVCLLQPQVCFLAYTKSGHLDWSRRPANLKVYWSIDMTSPCIPPPGPTAYLVAKGESPPTGAVTCVHTKDRHYCGEECVTCWLGTQDVYFHQH